MSARDRFEQTRKAVIEFNQIQVQKWLEGDEWQPENATAQGITDPTATRAIYLAEVWNKKLVKLERREKVLLELIGGTLRDIEEVRVFLGGEHAAILDQRYIDGLSWRDVEYRGKRIARSTGKLKVAQAFEWLDGR